MATVTLTISALLAIVAGVLILVWPKLIRLSLGLYLIIVGALQLMGNYVNLSP